MDLIVVTGSYGKKAVVKMLFQYLKNSSIKSIVYRYSDQSQEKILDYNQIQDWTRHNHLSDVQVVIIEISLNELSKLESLRCDYLVVTDHNDLDLKYESSQDEVYSMLNSRQLEYKQLILNSKSMNKLNDTKTCPRYFSLNSKEEYSLEVISNSIKGLVMKYKNKHIKTRLITNFHAENIICVIAVLELMSLYNYRKFKKVIKNIVIDGQVQKLRTRKNHHIIIDYRAHNFKNIIEEIVQTANSFNYNLIVSVKKMDMHKMSLWLKHKDVLEFVKSKYSYIVNQEEETVNDINMTLKWLVQNGIYRTDYLTGNKLDINKIQDKNEFIIMFIEDESLKTMKDMGCVI